MHTIVFCIFDENTNEYGQIFRFLGYTKEKVKLCDRYFLIDISYQFLICGDVPQELWC